VFILEGVKVVCFATLLQVLILMNLFTPKLCKMRLVSQVLQIRDLGRLTDFGKQKTPAWMLALGDIRPIVT